MVVVERTIINKKRWGRKLKEVARDVKEEENGSWRRTVEQKAKFGWSTDTRETLKMDGNLK